MKAKDKQLVNPDQNVTLKCKSKDNKGCVFMAIPTDRKNCFWNAMDSFGPIGGDGQITMIGKGRSYAFMERDECVY